jgi:hypothetical protein
MNRTVFAGLSWALAATCGAVALGRAAALRGWIPSPDLPWHLGEIAVWALGAFGILWGLERGSPQGMEDAPLPRLHRLAVLASALGMLAVWVYA